MKLSKKLVVALCCSAGVALNAAAGESTGEAVTAVATREMPAFEAPEIADNVEEGSEELQIAAPRSRRSSAAQSRKGHRNAAKLGRAAAVIAAILAALGGGYYMMNKETGDEQSAGDKTQEVSAEGSKKVADTPEEAAKPGPAADGRRFRTARNALIGLGGTAGIAALAAALYQVIQGEGVFSDFLNGVPTTDGFDSMNGTSLPPWAPGAGPEN
ncbi:putative transmembrane protein [Toxoplasma gondii RUB]|uniref:Transmembrane protein n=6 Tax=Toxoplasma gondii TaxID=5811 RepID=S7V4C7_TOXGG|nr:hypothetical protein TGGT1_273980 [Toxoplasma gondii GT1]KAF4641996.1 hypothetical protein TGRH88_078080 [Toxoplasma gondii]KFG49024.1 putative transmembrane protein [Toxoplasma gondii GAB2-2007-GAL-DOM2]KFG49964.1 putative transmembrane protein [Toxoplasma gondii FOU]KFG63972.1 putative transmembrane protein [Toxoplasma gondii RUB]PUA92449.1 putative transmembrane protein [Toxoplasma gondii TgCATBr9]